MKEILMSDEMVCGMPFLLIIVGAFIVGIFGTIWNKIDEARRAHKWRKRSKPYWQDGRRR